MSTLVSPLPAPASAGLRPVVGLWASLQERLRWLVGGFAVDLRSLAVFRIGFALLLLWDLSIAIPNAKAFYSDAGVMPRSFLLSSWLWESDAWWSLHAVSGSVWYQLTLMGAAVVAAVMLLLGWRTRLATAVSWLLLCSLQSRNPVILHSGDVVMRTGLFWGFFLPLGARWSLDARVGSRQKADNELLTPAGAVLLLQVCLIYWFTVLLRNDAMWHGSGSALLVALQLDLFVKPAGIWLRQFPETCRWLTWATMFMELWFPFVAFMPVKRTWCRWFVILSFWLLHAGIWLCLDVGPFSYIMCVAWMVFIPGSFWDRVGQGMRSFAAKLPGLRRLSTRLTARAVRLFRRHLEPLFRHRCGADYGLKPGVMSKFLVMGCFAYVLGWNIRGTDFTRHEKWFPREANWFGQALRLEEYWGMFAPHPLTDDGWFVCIGHLANGREVDFLREGTPATTWDKPVLEVNLWKDSRWQKYLNNLWDLKYSECRPGLMQYLCREWNRTHEGGERVTRSELWFVKEPTEADGSVTGRTERVKLYAAPVPLP